MMTTPSVAESASAVALLRESAATVHSLRGGDLPHDAPWVAIVDSRPCRREFVFNFLRMQKGLPERILAVSTADLMRDHAHDAEKAGDRAASDAPCLIIFSIGGVSVTDAQVSREFEQLLGGFTHVPIVVLSDLDSSDEAQLALAAGARGFVSTLLDPQLMCLALTLVQAGGIFAPPALINAWVQSGHGLASEPPGEPAAEPVPQYDELTARQTDVLHLLQEGFANKVIATKLNMTESTVKVHVRQIMRRLGASNRTEAALLAQRHQEALRRRAY